MVDPVFIGWLVFLGAILLIFRKNLQVQFPIILLKNEKLAARIDKAARGWKGWVGPLADVGVAVGFLGMAFVVYFLVKSLIDLLSPAGRAAVSVIIPGVRIPGSSVFLPFTYGIISIACLAIVHEFAHAIVASCHGVRPRSVAFALLLFIPAAGVEIDEKKLARHPVRTKLRIFAAGSFANFLFALLVLGLAFLAASLAAPHIVPVGTEIVSTDPSGPAFGIVPNGTAIVFANGTNVTGFADFAAFASGLKAGDKVELIAANGARYYVTAADKGDGKGKLGVIAKQKFETDVFGTSLIWLLGLFQWLFNLNIGVGIINLFPFPIMDGGRMVEAITTEKFGEKKAKGINRVIFTITAPLLALNILVPIVKAIFFK